MSAFKSIKAPQKLDSDPLANFKGGKKLDYESEEVNFIKFQYLLGIKNSFDISNFEVWKLENIDASMQYDKEMKSLLKVPSWIRISSLSHENNIENISRRGFVFSPQEGGMTFTTGNIDVSINSSLSSQVLEIVYVFCDIAVGKGLVSDLADISRAIPVGYDSYYIPDQPLDQNNDGEFSLSEYQAAANFDGRSPS